ncbi:MAG: hypothetical protein EBX50_18775 [Chitinophagia bacterium]|nr:hypothetical protein [Chitinophagia bacterium]
MVWNVGTPSDLIIDLHKINCFYLKEKFGNVHLITDSESKPFFDHLPWTTLTTELDIVSRDYPQVWSLSKLYAFKHIANKEEPFIHIDNDVILWEGMPKELKDKEVFGQSWEDVDAYNYEPKKVYENCPNLHIFEKSNTTKAVNVGIFGGTNTQFIQNYAKAAIAFILDPANEYFWKKYSGYEMHWAKAVLAEQWFLAAFADYHKIKIHTLFNDWPTQEEAKEKKYTHLMIKKRDPEIIKKIKNLANQIISCNGELLNLGFK